MPRPRNPFPNPRNHKGTAVIDLYVGSKRRQFVLGPWGSPEADAEFKRLVAERNVSHGVAGSPDITLEEVCTAFKRHAAEHYVRADGSKTHEVFEFDLVCRMLLSMYRYKPAREFGPLALKAVRETFISAGWCRSLVNRRVNRVRHIFKWAESEQLVPSSIRYSLTSVAGLQRGRTKAPESPPVLPVSEEHVNAVLPFLPPEIAAMVRIQKLTGMRPGEVCMLQPSEIDKTGPVWLYRPSQHKTGWRGKARVIAIGPNAQTEIERFTPPDPGDYYFSPRRAVERFHAERAARRKHRPASHAARNERKRVASPKCAPASHYDACSYGRAIARACDRAFPPPAPLCRMQVPDQRTKKRMRLETEEERIARLTADQIKELAAWRERHRWHPNQLRHSHATAVRKHYGLEAAQVSLGHSRADVTQVYAERDMTLAVKVASEMG